MKINIQSLKADPVVISADLDPSLFDLGEDARFLAPVAIELDVHRISEKVHIRGKINTIIELSCSRCLEQFSWPFQITTLEFIAVPENLLDHRRQEENEQMQENDPATIVYRSDQLDMIPEIQNFIILSLPMKPLCAQDCQGLCVHCGGKIGEGGCDGHHPEENNPFSVLQKLKPKS